MRRLLAALLIPILAAGVFARSLLLDPAQTGQLIISGTAATQIFTNDSAATRSYVINNSTCNVFLVGSSTTTATPATGNQAFSISTTTGSFLLQGELIGPTTFQANVFALDGNGDAFTGPLWGETSCASGTAITRYRTH